jgi:hypothetical protein
MAILVVAKKMRDGLRMFAEAALRAGCDMAGAKAQSFRLRSSRPG